MCLFTMWCPPLSLVSYRRLWGVVELGKREGGEKRIQGRFRFDEYNGEFCAQEFSVMGSKCTTSVSVV